MFKITAIYSVVAIAITICNSTANAQQANKPIAPTTVNPTVEPVPNGYATGTKVNYVRTWEAMGPYTDAGLMTGADYQHVKQATQYVDGLGRPLQTISRQMTPQAKDMVSPVRYDEFGREVFKYLPYVSTENNGVFKMSPFADQAAFYQNTSLNPYLQGEQVYYSQTNFEASPLNRVTKAMAPGNSWAGSSKGISLEYLVNAGNDVCIWNISNNPLAYGSDNDVMINRPSTSTYYNAGELYMNVTKDEAGNAVVEYKDKEGQAILKKVQIGNIATDYSGYNGFLCTYYVYDDLNQLRFVIPPDAVEAIRTNWQFTDRIINELCFRYEYDSRKRMIAKKVPGAGWVYMVYDTRDRLVFSQDANIRRNNNQWLATLYDGLNRPVMTGMITYSGNPNNLQQTVNTQTATPSNPNTSIPVDLVLNSTTSGTKQALRSITLDENFESVTNGEMTAEIISGTSGPDGETTVIEDMAVNKNPLPAGNNFIALTKTYYDNYNWTSTTYKSDYNSYLEQKSLNLHPVTMPSQAYSQTKELVTGSKIRVIENPNNLAAGNWLTTVNFFRRQSQTHTGQQRNTKRKRYYY